MEKNEECELCNTKKVKTIQIHVKQDTFYYEDGKGWTTYDDTEKKWISCDEPSVVTEHKNKKQNEN